MSTCNHCSLLAIKRDAKKNKKRVVVLPSSYSMGGVEVHVLKPREKPNEKNWVAWFMSADYCVR